MPAFKPLATVLGRAASSLAYGIFNELFQNGTLAHLNVMELVVDVVLDTALSFTYRNIDFVNIVKKTDNILSSLIGSAIEFMIDLIETSMFLYVRRKKFFDVSNY